jgi:hypothetical protein
MATPAVVLRALRTRAWGEIGTKSSRGSGNGYALSFMEPEARGAPMSREEVGAGGGSMKTTRDTGWLEVGGCADMGPRASAADKRR